MNYPDWASYILYLEKRQQLAVMAVVILLALGVFASQAYTLGQLLRTNAPAITAQAGATQHPKPVPKIIASVPLFGNPTIAAEEAASKNLPTTNLQLVLRGAVVESDASKSSAVIEEPSKPAVSYKVGDTLPGGAALNSVYADHVVIKRNGQLETLNFPVQNKVNIKNNQTANTENRNVPPGMTKLEQPGNAQPQSIKERLQELQKQYKPH